MNIKGLPKKQSKANLYKPSKIPNKYPTDHTKNSLAIAIISR